VAKQVFRKPGEPAPLVAMRYAAKAVSSADKAGTRVRVVVNKAQFPLRAPTVPGGVLLPPSKKRTGADFDTAWARKPLAVFTRRVILSGAVAAGIRTVASPQVHGLDRLADLRAAALDALEDDEQPPAVIFAANHQSHLDAPLMLTSVPRPWRDRLVVGAAADYFFGTRVSGTAAALALGAIPIDRAKVNRRSADLVTDLLNDRWSIVIFPEGGRSPDGWGQPFRGGAAFLSVRTGCPIVPVHLDGTGAIWGKGRKTLEPGRTRVTFGPPLVPGPGEDARELGERLEHAVARLADEATSDWWSAALRSGRGETPSLAGPQASSWRRAWAITDHRRRLRTGPRKRTDRTWPAS
jgi:1-acyl-sn-glycerol-3-phosphate acyltransferase